MSDQLNSIGAKLRTYSLHVGSKNLPDLVNDIYKSIFRGHFYQQIWDEQILLAIQYLVQEHPPDQEVYGARLESIRARTALVVAINDIFAAAIFRSKEEITAQLGGSASQLNINPEMIPALTNTVIKARAGGLQSLDLISKIVGQFSVDIPALSAALSACFEAVKLRLEVGAVTGLLITQHERIGTILPVRTLVQPGAGEVKLVVSSLETFRSAVGRALDALKHQGWLGANQDVIFSTHDTDATYSGSSIALAAAMAMYSSAKKWQFDPYTAFTGDINIINNEWRVRHVDGIREKLGAALKSGIRRVVLPAQNRDDIPEKYQSLTLVLVDEITEVLEKLALPQDATPAETVQQEKASLMKTHCAAQGWQISGARAIQKGLQYTITPATEEELTINIYESGTHTPKQHKRPEFQQLLSRLNEIDKPETPLQSVQRIFNIKEPALREEIKKHFAALQPSQSKTEQYCDYVFIFENGKEKLVVKQYGSGKLQLQGLAGPIYRQILEIVVSRYNLHHPSATLSVDTFLASTQPHAQANPSIKAEQVEIILPHIGTDESGKGDYFGPLVIAGLWVDKSLEVSLANLGVRDSKQLTDRRCQELALKIREMCSGKYQVVEISPEKYNQLYEQFLREKKNLNHLLAWGHARAIESLLGRQNCKQAIADQFGDEKYIASKLMEKGKTLNLVQTPKAERFISVAAASVLARDHFVSRLNQLSKEAGVNLPKGASSEVIEAAKQIMQKSGADALRKFAKLHFKTTASVLGRN